MYHITCDFETVMMKAGPHVGTHWLLLNDLSLTATSLGEGRGSL